jgi:hypothetical protein
MGIEIIKSQDDLKRDPLTGSTVIISYEHYEIHNNNHYTVSDYDNEVDTGTPKYWLFTTGADKYIHFRVRVVSSLNGLIEIFENPTITDNGTEITIYNNFRSSVNIPDMTAYYDPTVTDDGTRLYVEVMGSDGTNPNGSGGGIMQSADEFILKQNEEYLVKYTTDSNDNRVSICAEFYEGE